MPPTSTIPASPPRPPRTRPRLPIVVAAVVGSALLLFQVSTALQPPDRIDRLTIHNETDYHLNTTLRCSPDGSRLLLGPVRRNATKTIQSVIDLGDSFVFDLSHGGVEMGSITVDRDALQEDNWQMTIPAHMSEPLRAAGLAPPPG